MFHNLAEDQDKKIRVLIAHYHPNIISGAERSIADFVDKRDERFQIIMLIPGNGNLSDFYNQRGYPVWSAQIQTRRRLFPGLHTFQSILFARDLKEKHIDVVISNTFPAACRVGDACSIAGKPHGIYIREYIPDTRVYRRVLDKSERVFAVSRDVQFYLGTMTNPEKIVLAYNHINSLRIQERIKLHKERGIRLLPFRLEHPVVGIVGRITKDKQQDLFLRIIPNVLREIPHTRFVIIGSAPRGDNNYVAYLKKLANDLGVAEHVAFMGYRKDAIEIISELTVVCLPSKREPLGRVILESQIIGCPVVASDTGGSSEIIQDGLTGLLFSLTGENPVEQFASQIIRLLKDIHLRHILINNAKKSVCARFTGYENVRILEQYLEDLITNYGSSNAR